MPHADPSEIQGQREFIFNLRVSVYVALKSGDLLHNAQTYPVRIYIHI